MVLTSSRILSCGVWLILMRKTSAPASNRRLIIALSEEAGPSVARILIRRRRLMAWFRALRLAADQSRRNFISFHTSSIHCGMALISLHFLLQGVSFYCDGNTPIAP